MEEPTDPRELFPGEQVKDSNGETTVRGVTGGE